jgi:hypothetical protein
MQGMFYGISAAVIWHIARHFPAHQTDALKETNCCRAFFCPCPVNSVDFTRNHLAFSAGGAAGVLVKLHSGDYRRQKPRLLFWSNVAAAAFSADFLYFAKAGMFVFGADWLSCRSFMEVVGGITAQRAPVRRCGAWRVRRPCGDHGLRSSAI